LAPDALLVTNRIMLMSHAHHHAAEHGMTRWSFATSGLTGPMS
jgi:hypothetical protein